MTRAEVREWRKRKQVVYDLTREIASIAGIEGEAFEEVVDVWAEMLLNKISVAEAEKRLKRILDDIRK